MSVGILHVQLIDANSAYAACQRRKFESLKSPPVLIIRSGSGILYMKELQTFKYNQKQQVNSYVINQYFSFPVLILSDSVPSVTLPGSIIPLLISLVTARHACRMSSRPP